MRLARRSSLDLETTINHVTTQEQSEYPLEWEADVVLRDGSTARVRPIRPDDSKMLDAFHRRQSQESVYFRFFRYRPELSDKELSYFTTIDYDARMAFVALVGDTLVAVARYESWNSPHHPGKRVGEVAFFTDDAHHGKGLATLLLEYLAAAARQNGMDRFTATVLPANFNMLRVFRKAGFDVSTRFEDGAIEVDLGIDVTDEATEAIAARGRVSQARSIERIFRPGSVAVIGAGRTSGSVGHELVRNLVDGGFAGSISLINHRAEPGDLLFGIPLLRSIADVPSEESIDLAIIAVPARSVEKVVSECVDRDVNALLIVSAGFSEAGPEGKKLEHQIVSLARSNGLRLIGPNSFGFINTNADVSLRAVYVPMATSAGVVGISSQSGPLGAAVVQQMTAAGVGISTFAAMGNRGDVSVNDLLQYWTEDDNTKAVALYLESFGNLRNFTSIAKHLSARKPIVAVSPHDEELAELLAQSGLILVDHVGELAQQCKMIIDQPMPLGSRVAIVSNTASVARLAAAACRQAGLVPVVPSSISQTPASDAVLVGDLDSLRLPEGSTAETYEQVVVAAAVSDEVDLVLLALVPTLDVSIDELGRLLHQVNRAVAKPMVATGLVDPELLNAPGLPAFTFPEEAARALGRMAEHARWRSMRHGDRIEAGAEQGEQISESVRRVLGEHSTVALDLMHPDLEALLQSWDVPVARFGSARSEEEACELAGTVGFPIVLKAGGVATRTAGESGGVALDIHDDDALRAAFDRMSESFGDDFLPAIIQQSVQTGAHVRVGLDQSSEHGARLVVGIGGSSAERLPPRARIVLPTSEAELDHVLEEDWLMEAVPSAAARFRLRDLLSQLAAVADASPDVAMVACNPVLVTEDEVITVDVEVRLQPWSTDPLAEVRHL